MVGTPHTYWIAPSTSQSPAVRLIEAKLYVDPLVREAEMLPLVTNSPTKPAAALLFPGQQANTRECAGHQKFSFRLIWAFCYWRAPLNFAPLPTAEESVALWTLSMDYLYLEVISFVERLHRQFLEVVKLELEGLGIHGINNVQAMMLFQYRRYRDDSWRTHAAWVLCGNDGNDSPVGGGDGPGCPTSF